MTQARPRSLDVPEDATIPPRHPEAPAVGMRTPPHHEACRGCSDVPGALGVESWVDDDRGEGGEPGHGVAVRSRMLVTDAMQGAPGLLHGGFLTAAFDESLGSVPALVTRATVTARLETDFRLPVPVGTTLWLRARLDGVLGRKYFVSAVAHLDTEDGPVAATARALFVRVGLEHFLRHSRPEDLEALGVAAEDIRNARS
jgi:acyl-coenzyme A thioesterase PaaI-like protein